ncbi:GNAT family N-acetyltransferase [Streptomyces sp. NPDC020719]|uniref:GNAT family N-acetyltransferase n=1 Tax=Streptomyces sp. NPDC020719 TaxID=3154896 RepID=UPI0033DECE5B
MDHFRIRRGTPEDQEAVAEFTGRRFAWMKEHGYAAWPQTPEEVASRAAMAECPFYVLERNGVAVGCTILLDKPGTAVFTEAEREEPCYVLTSSVTDPLYRGQRLGERIAEWALEKAAGDGRVWVRRVTTEGRLADYYKAQGFDVLRVVERNGHPVWGMQRKAA